jgi:hypothetical protein
LLHRHCELGPTRQQLKSRIGLEFWRKWSDDLQKV